MAIAQRKAIYSEIEAYRGHPLITYITSGRVGASGTIALDGARIIADQLRALPPGTREIDLLVNSLGGDGLASWRIVTMIREYLGEGARITCLVPYYAFSAATLIAVGCNDIFMHPLATLGPVDPQITMMNKDGSQQQFAYEDVTAYIRFLKEEAGMTEQVGKEALLEPLVAQIAPSVIGGAKRASIQSKIMAERLLKLHMSKEDSQKAEKIAEELSKNFFAHGHAVTKSDAKRLGLSILDSDERLEGLIWNIYTDIEAEMKMSEVFDPTAVLVSSPQGIVLLEAPPAVILPTNAPQDLVQHIWAQVASQALRTGPAIDIELVHALIESSRRADTYITKGRIVGSRMPTLGVQVAIIWTSQTWVRGL